MLHDDSHGNDTSTDGSRGTGQITSNNDKDKDKAKTNTEFTNISESLDTAIKAGDMNKVKEISSQLRKLVTARSNTYTSKGEQIANEFPTMLMIQYAFTSKGDKVWVLWDSASDTNYCTKELAKRLKLVGDPFILVINGIAGIQTRVETVRYVIKLRSKFGSVPVVVYSIDELATIFRSVEVSSLTKLFPNYSVKQLERSSECDILLSQANASLMPSKHIVNGDLVMWSGLLGNVVGGSHPDLREEGACNLPGRSTTYKAFSLKAMSGEIRFADPKFLRCLILRYLLTKYYHAIDVDLAYTLTLKS